MLSWVVNDRRHSCHIRKSCSILALPLPLFLLNFQLSTLNCLVVPPDLSIPAAPLSHYPPNSFALNLFADHHHLNPVVSIFYKNIEGALPRSRVTPAPIRSGRFVERGRNPSSDFESSSFGLSYSSPLFSSSYTFFSRLLHTTAPTSLL